MHKDLWSASRWGRGGGGEAGRVKNSWPSPGPAAFSRSQFAHACRGLSQAAGRKWSAIPPGSSCSIPGYKPSRSPLLSPRARLFPPRPPGGGPGSQGWSWGGDPRLKRCERGGGGSGFWAVPRLPNPPAWASRVQGEKAAPGWRQTGARWSAQATNPVQPKAAAAARATANRSRERASDRSGLGTCGQEGGIRSPRHGPRIGSWHSPRLRP